MTESVGYSTKDALCRASIRHSRKILLIVIGLSLAWRCGSDSDSGSNPSSSWEWLKLDPSSVTVAEGKTAWVRIRCGASTCGVHTDADNRPNQVCCVQEVSMSGECNLTVYGYEHGTDAITVSLANWPHVTASLQVTVTHVDVSRVLLTADTTIINVALGAITITSAFFDNTNLPLHRKTLEWSVSDTTIVDAVPMPAQGCGNPYMRIYGSRPGTVTIAASTDGKESNQISVVVLP